MRFLHVILLNLIFAEETNDCVENIVRLDGAKRLIIAIFASLLCGIGLGLLICPGMAFIRGKMNKPTVAWEP